MADYERCPGTDAVAAERVDDGYYVACPECPAILLPRVGGIVPFHQRDVLFDGEEA